MGEIKYCVCDACGVDDRDLAHGIKVTGHSLEKGTQLWLCRMCQDAVDGACKAAVAATVDRIRGER